MVDCSDVIPVPKTIVDTPIFPAGHSNKDIEQAVCISFTNTLPILTYFGDSVPQLPSQPSLPPQARPLLSPLSQVPK